jgi:ABC-type branched-subunit amino acid transport system substrate-binding protein
VPYRRLLPVIALATSVVLFAAGCGSSGGGGSSSQPSAAPVTTPAGGKSASEIGITADTIRVAVVADVDNVAAPGLFNGSVLAVKAYADYVNKHGGIAGRRLVVDFIDSKLSPDAAQTAVIQACEQDFALVGTSALFLNNIGSLTGCKDKAGNATGLPDLAVVQTDVIHQCSPVSYSISGTPLVCATKDDHPQTYYEPVGALRWLKQTQGLTTGTWIEGNDIKGALDATLPWVAAEQTQGISGKSFLVSGAAPEATYTPFIQALARDKVDYIRNLGTSHVQSLALKEAFLQSKTFKVWSCTAACYSRQFLTEAGSLADGVYVDTPYLPYEETQVPAVKTMVDAIGANKMDGFAELAWATSNLFQTAVQQAVAKVGDNGLTRAALLAALPTLHSFDAGGLIGKVDIGARRGAGCFVQLRVENGQLRRVYPQKPGTMDCSADNVIKVTYDNQ